MKNTDEFEYSYAETSPYGNDEAHKHIEAFSN